MRNQLSLATTTAPAIALALALSACGGGADDGEADDPSPVEEVITAEPDGDTLASETDGEEAEGADVAGDDEDGAAADADDAPEPVASASARPSPTPTPTPSATRVASMDPPAAFTTCGVCHSVERGENNIGPTLAGVVGRKAGSVSGANYSQAMQSTNITWTEANLRRYILDPNAVVPGGSMPDPGTDAAQTQSIINYLKTL